MRLVQAARHPVRAFFVVIGLSGLLAACGGGGSGGPTVDSGTSTPAPTPQPAAPQATYASPQLYVQKQAIATLAPTVSGTATSYSVSPALPAGLVLDAGTGAISGTPAVAAADTDYAITVTGPGGAATTHLHLTVEPAVAVTPMAVQGTAISPVLALDARALGLSGTVYAQASDAAGFFSAPITVSTSADGYLLELTSQNSASSGLHTGQFVISLCRDAACATPQPMPGVVVSYAVRVLAPGDAWPGDHLTTLAALPGAPEWSTFQGNAAHTGYVPVTLDTNQFATRWQTSVPAFLGSYGFRNLATLTTAGGSFYVAGANAVTAHSEYDGSARWSHSFSSLAFPSVNPPAVSNGVVYVAAGQQASTSMFGLDASSGAVLFQSAMSSQWENYLAPTVAPSGVYTNAGSGLYGLDAQGTQLFAAATAQQSSWTPAVDASAVYAYTGDALRVFDPVSGTLRKSISDPTFTNFIYEIGGSAVLGAPNSVFAAAYDNTLLNGGSETNALVHFNLQSNTADWNIAGGYLSTPAYDSGVVYALNHHPLQLEARAETDGTLLWSWTPPARGDTGFLSEVLLTKNALIVSTNLSTYAIDRATHHTVWSYPAAGNLALSANGILYIEGYGTAGSTAPITAINVH